MYLPCLLFYLFASGSFEATPVYRILKGHVVKHVKHMEAVLALLFAHFPTVFPTLLLAGGKLWDNKGNALPKHTAKVVRSFLLFKFWPQTSFESAVRTLSVKGAFVGHRENFN